MTLAPDPNWQDEHAEALMAAVAKLRNTEEAGAFLRDLCTRRELEEMSKRWAVARMLDKGQPYRAVAEATGTSTATVTRIAQWLNYGTGGYRMMLDRIKRSRR